MPGRGHRLVAPSGRVAAWQGRARRGSAKVGGRWVSVSLSVWARARSKWRVDESVGHTSWWFASEDRPGGRVVALGGSRRCKGQRLREGWRRAEPTEGVWAPEARFLGLCRPVSAAARSRSATKSRKCILVAWHPGWSRIVFAGLLGAGSAKRGSGGRFGRFAECTFAFL